MLWVGCGNVADTAPFGLDDQSTPVVWHCFVMAEVSLWKRLFYPRPDTAAAISKLNFDLG
jgi:hypothetical protein